MRSHFLTAVIMLVSTVGYSQVDANQDQVAIGLGASSTSTTYRFSYEGKSVGHYGLGWYSNVQLAGDPIGYLAGFGGLKFFTNATPRLFISREGNVGIGTTTPSRKLSIVGDPGLSVTSSNGFYMNLNYIYGASSGSLYSLNSSGGIADLTINPEGGNVGIGTLTPNATLHLQAPRVVETIQATGDHATLRLIAADKEGGGAPSVYLFRGSDNLYGAFFVERGTGGGNQPLFTGGVANDVILGSVSPTPLKFGVNSDVKMTIDASGNVGIGTIFPTEKLSVNGKIRATEIKVETTGWHDYVFDEGYEIRSLASLEEYVKANKHLPEIPSEAAVKADGIDLGEMNGKLLKKIEELTLYLIEQNKKLEKQGEQLRDLQLSNDQLHRELKKNMPGNVK